jgi:glycosyltransferase involved in cell wall biosynthesis
VWRREIFPWFPLSPKVRIHYAWSRGTWTIAPTDVLILGGWKSERYYAQLRGRARSTVQLAWAYDAWATGTDDEKREVERGLSNAEIPFIAGSSLVAAMVKGFGREPLAVICPGIDTTVFHPRAVADDRPCTIGFILGRGPSKGTADGLAALRILRTRGCSFAVVAVGSNRSYDLPDWVVCRTASDDAAMADFYTECSIFMVSSLAEGFGLPALEAMACGTAVVSTDNGGVRDFAQPGDNILLAPVGDPEAIADQLEILVTDTARRQQIALAGSVTAQEFSWDQSTDAFEQALMAVTA